MKKIYLVLTHTGTILSRIIQTYTGNEYSHVSIALDEDLKEIYSFGRLYPNIAFLGGFVHESLTSGTFKKFYRTKALVKELEVTAVQYQKLCEVIETIKEKQDLYGFNVLGLFMVSINRKRYTVNKFYCAEFVKFALEEADIDTSFLPEIIKPEDFKNFKGTSDIYKGLLSEYRQSNWIYS